MIRAEYRQDGNRIDYKTTKKQVLLLEKRLKRRDGETLRRGVILRTSFSLYFE